MRWGLSIAVSLLLAACGNEEKVDAPVSPPEPALAQQLGPYQFEGLWANSFTDCSLGPGSAENAPILISADRFVGYENECTVTGIIILDKANGRFEVTRDCTAEGEAYSDQVVLRVSGDTLMMQSDAASVTWLRCPTLGGAQ